MDTIEQSNTEPQSGAQAPDFRELAGRRRAGLVAEFWDFLMHNKKWWLLPVVLVLLLLGGLILVSGTAWAPFIYTLF